jgi:peptidoglycan hydrolase CwlO-like protein
MQNLLHNRKEHLQNEQNLLHNRKEHLQNDQNLLHKRKKEQRSLGSQTATQTARGQESAGGTHRDKRKKKRWQTQLVKTNDNSAGRATQGSNQYWAVLTFPENRRFLFFERIEKTALVLF